MELVTLTRTLDLNKGQRVNIYTDSKYAYLILHVHATIRKEKKKSLKQQQENLLNVSEIERLLAAIYCPKKNDCYTLQKAQQGWE